MIVRKIVVLVLAIFGYWMNSVEGFQNPSELYGTCRGKLILRESKKGKFSQASNYGMRNTHPKGKIDRRREVPIDDLRSHLIFLSMN